MKYISIGFYDLVNVPNCENVHVVFFDFIFCDGFFLLLGQKLRLCIRLRQIVSFERVTLSY